MSCAKFHIIKPEIRVLGIDDGAFRSHKEGYASMVGIVFRGGYWLDGVMHTRITVDGMDATERLKSMIMNSPHYKQLRVVMLDGITCAGFNIVDIKVLNIETKLPIITITRDKPNIKDIRKALKNLPDINQRWKAIQNAGELYEVRSRKDAKVYMQIAGICRNDAERIVKLTSTRSDVPEALRVAHLIASGVTADMPEQ